MRRSRFTILLGAAAAADYCVAACGSDDSGSNDTTATTALAPPPGRGRHHRGGGRHDGDAPGSGSFTVGSADFSESQLLGRDLRPGAGGRASRWTASDHRRLARCTTRRSSDDEVQTRPRVHQLAAVASCSSDRPDATPTATNVERADHRARRGAARRPPGAHARRRPRTRTSSSAPATSPTKYNADQPQRPGQGVRAASPSARPPEFETRSPFGLVGFEETTAPTFKEFVPLQVRCDPDALSAGQIDCGNLSRPSRRSRPTGSSPSRTTRAWCRTRPSLPLVRTPTASTPEVAGVSTQISAALDHRERSPRWWASVDGDAAEAPAEVAERVVLAARRTAN